MTEIHAELGLDLLMIEVFALAQGIEHLVLVSPEGFPLATSADCSVDLADQIAGNTHYVMSICRGAAPLFNGGKVIQTILEMEHGLVVIMTINDGSCLAAMTPNCDMGLVGRAMAGAVHRIGALLTPEVRARLLEERARLLLRQTG